MSNEIVSYAEMCQREGLNLQRGMNFSSSGRPSILLMSQRSNAPYTDTITKDGLTLIYEGHDEPKTSTCPNPKLVDQPERLPSGKLTENGKFHNAANEYKSKLRSPEMVRVYEKLRPGIWSFNGVFQLIDSCLEGNGVRKVFKFTLRIKNVEAGKKSEMTAELSHGRLIPTRIKLEVWKRDRGKCVMCGANDELHFDHILPYSRGGTSLAAENVQLLCVRHNLEKRDNIE